MLVLVYLDTNVILDDIEKRNRCTISFFERLKTDEDLSAVTSIFGIVEVIDLKGQIIHTANLVVKKKTWDEIGRQRTKELSQDERSRAIEDVNDFRKRNQKVKIYEVKEEGWDTVLRVMKDLDVSAPDAIHIATALNAECDVFFSNDSNLTSAISKNPSYSQRLRCANPQNIDKIAEKVKKRPRKEILEQLLRTRTRGLESLTDFKAWVESRDLYVDRLSETDKQRIKRLKEMLKDIAERKHDQA